MPDPPAAAVNEWTIGKLLMWTRSHFESRGVDEPRLSAEILLAHVLGCRRIELYARFEHSPTDDERTKYRELVRKAAEHHPIAYLVGHKEFYSLDFLVTPDVLIPRPETELLVERALDWCQSHPKDRHDLLDVGTGSGCIAIAIAKRQPTVQAAAADLSEAALAIAAENVRRHGLSDRIQTVYADLLDLPEGAFPAEGFDIIVSNPPYIADADRENLPANVRDFEPAVALFDGGDGLNLYRRIADDTPKRLNPDGLLLLEVGIDQADDVETILTGAGHFEPAGRYKDANGIERALAFTLVI